MEPVSETAPRELPPWLQRQQGLASTSYSASQEISEDTKEFIDIKSTSPEDVKALSEVCFYISRLYLCLF